MKIQKDLCIIKPSNIGLIDGIICEDYFEYEAVKIIGVYEQECDDNTDKKFLSKQIFRLRYDELERHGWRVNYNTRLCNFYNLKQVIDKYSKEGYIHLVGACSDTLYFKTAKNTYLEVFICNNTNFFWVNEVEDFKDLHINISLSFSVFNEDVTCKCSSFIDTIQFENGFKVFVFNNMGEGWGYIPNCIMSYDDFMDILSKV